MAWIIDMEDYRAGFNRTATEEQIEITDAVAWAKDKLNFEADAAQPKFSQRAPNEASSTARANGANRRCAPSKYSTARSTNQARLS